MLYRKSEAVSLLSLSVFLESTVGRRPWKKFSSASCCTARRFSTLDRVFSLRCRLQAARLPQKAERPLCIGPNQSHLLDRFLRRSSCCNILLSGFFAYHARRAMCTKWFRCQNRTDSDSVSLYRLHSVVLIFPHGTILTCTIGTLPNTSLLLACCKARGPFAEGFRCKMLALTKLPWSVTRHRTQPPRRRV